jgi:DNA ligase (NAD+)
MLSIHFSLEQIEILNQFDTTLDPNLLQQLFAEADLAEADLLTLLKASNALYRSGQQVITDQQYDSYISMLKNINPLHSFFKSSRARSLGRSENGRIA